MSGLADIQLTEEQIQQLEQRLDNWKTQIRATLQQEFEEKYKDHKKILDMALILEDNFEEAGKYTVETYKQLIVNEAKKELMK